MSLIVVTVVKNDLDGLKRTQNSVTLQSSKVKWKIVTPFDQSPTHHHAQRLLEDGLILELTEDEGSGVYGAMNQSVFSSLPQEWIWFLNAGDEFGTKDSYQQVVNKIEKPTSRWLYGGYFVATKIGEIIGEREPVREFSATKHLFGIDSICHQATIMQASLMQELNGFDRQYTIAADWDLIVRASFLESPMIINEPICIFYLGGLSTTSRNKGNFELLRVRSQLLPAEFRYQNYKWFITKLVRHFIVMKLENITPKLVNSLRMKARKKVIKRRNRYSLKDFNE